MPDYKFHNKNLGLSDDGIHLMRNGFNYKTLSYSEVSRVEITRGNALKNRLVLMIAGLAMTGLSIFLILRIIDIFSPDSNVSRVSVEGLLIPVFPLLLGVYCIYAVSKKETILIVTGNKKSKFSLTGFEKAGQLESIKSFLSQKTIVKQ